MKSVKWILPFVAVIVAACNGGTVTETTSPTPAPEATARIITTTTVPALEVETQNCGSPPVTFSPLCEVYDLLEQWHVDAPFDPGFLAAAAVRGLRAFEPESTEEPPRTLICAIPDAAFSVLCDELARRIQESQVPVGPAVEAAMSYMIDVGLDPFTYYLPANQAGSLRLNGIVSGVGVLLDARDTAGSKCTEVTEVCRLEVVVVLEDNPASAAGLLSGDVVTHVDGASTLGRGFTGIVAEIAGDETGTVVLTIDRDGESLDIPIVRSELTVPTVEYGVPIDDVGYVRIPDFEADIPDLVEASLEEMVIEGMSTLVVDLRDNPGGLVDAVVEVADQFVDGGVVLVSDAPDEHLEYEAEPGGLVTEQRLLVLVNQGTASAAEILAGTLRDRRDALIIGSNTFGKDAVQIPFSLRNGAEFYVAVARWSTPNGLNAADGGLIPDRELAWPTGATATEVVELALEASS
ncbi:MAG TPA: S41 family peptidase [Acidimicrobiia bacterium]|nr:S41 family peptidase [Acidimicrobiia bacterium]